MSETTLPVASGDGGNMNIGMQDPNNSIAPNQSAGGKTKVQPTEQSVDSRDQHINGDKVSFNGMAPDGNSSGIPAAVPIDPLTYGDPNDTAVDHKDGYSTTGADEERHGF